MSSAKIDSESDSGIRGFLNRGGFWPLLLVVAVYFAIYLPTGRVAARVADRSFSEDDLLSSVGTVFVQLTAALVVGSIVLIAFTTFMGWNAEIFGRQSIYRSRWMWLAPVIVLVPIILRVLGIDWGGPALSVVLLVLVTGALIGFSEELLFRGIAVKMLRSGGHREWSVAAISSVLFGASHSLNIFSGEPLTSVAFTVLYTVAFGALMYVSMRVVGFLVAAMVLHGLTDPTVILSTGGLPGAVEVSVPSGLLALTSGFTLFVLTPVGILMLFFVRGRVGEPKGAKAEAA